MFHTVSFSSRELGGVGSVGDDIPIGLVVLFFGDLVRG